jgi:hypothetical protein
VSTYTPIASVTLSSAQSSVTFSGIPQTYTDLILVVNNIVSSGTGNDTALRFNDDTSSNYSNTYLLGTGTSALSGRNPLTYADNGYLDANSGNPNTRIIHLMNYTNTTTFKTQLTRASGQNGGQVTAYVNLWRSTSAITKILVYSADSLNYASGSTFNLYGVANASITNVAKATGGDSVTTDGTYWYHTFRSSGTFTPTQALTADYLVVAGGGAGGPAYYGGGGGAGGLLSTVSSTGGGGSLQTPLTMSLDTAYTVTVGAGGSGGTSSFTARGTAGSNSSITGSGITTVTATGGGGGGTFSTSGQTAGGDGGSSGGGGGGSASAGGTRTASPVQGYTGGTGANDGGSTYAAGGGGGGAGANGGNPSGSGASGTGGAGGAGVSNSITGSSVTYGGGGGGGYGRDGGVAGGNVGPGGSGGGGNGSTNGSAGSNGTANTGGGGGGAGGYPQANGTGGSGIIVIRYSAA